MVDHIETVRFRLATAADELGVRCLQLDTVLHVASKVVLPPRVVATATHVPWAVAMAAHTMALEILLKPKICLAMITTEGGA